MRKLLNRVLVKFGYLITKAPDVLSGRPQTPLDLLPGNLKEKFTIRETAERPDNELFRMFAADTNVHKWHHYFGIYTRHFERYRARPIRMLEIGVFRGGSLRMWNQYFHAGSTIVGIDIDENCKQYEVAEQQIFVRIGDQANTEFLAAVNEEFGPFDIILDDGSHKTRDQIVTFGALFRDALKDGGCYMLEDMHTNYWRRTWIRPYRLSMSQSVLSIRCMNRTLSGRKRTFDRITPKQ